MLGSEKSLGPVVAGTWYPADGAALRRQLEGFFGRAGDAAAQASPGGRTLALIAPHAGFVYSGRVAAGGFREVERTGCRRVLLLGPSHFAAFEGAVLPGAAVCRTPLGDVPIDDEARDALLDRDGFRLDDGPYRREHCLEAELPFLQFRLGAGFRVLPALVGMLGPHVDARTLAAGLAPLLDDETLVVISSDFTHFGPRFDFVPFEDDVPRRIEALDRGAIRHIVERDARGFEDYVRRTGATICGRNPIRVLLELLPGASVGRLVDYDTSGRITGEWDHSVSYASLVFRTAGP